MTRASRVLLFRAGELFHAPRHARAAHIQTARRACHVPFAKCDCLTHDFRLNFDERRAERNINHDSSAVAHRIISSHHRIGMPTIAVKSKLAVFDVTKRFIATGSKVFSSHRLCSLQNLPTMENVPASQASMAPPDDLPGQPNIRDFPFG